jgi:hypothetical protein
MNQLAHKNINNIGKRISFKYLLPAILLAIIAFSGFIVRTSALTNATIFFYPGTSALPTDRIVSLKINSGTSKVGFVRVSFSFDKSKLALSGEITHTTPFDTEIEKTSMTEANNLGAARIVVAVPPAKAENAQSGEFELAQIPFHVLSTAPNDATVVIFDKDDIQIVDMQNNTISFDIENPAYTLNMQTSTETPTATITMSPSPTLSATATPTMTISNTGTITPTPSSTITPTNTETSTPTATATITSTPTTISTPTITPTNSVTPTSTTTPSPTAPTNTPTASPTATQTPSATTSVSNTPLITDTATPTQSVTIRPTNTVSPTITPSPKPSNDNGNRFGWFKKLWDGFRNKFSFFWHRR